MKHYQDQYEDEAYFSRQPFDSQHYVSRSPMKKQTEDEKPSKGRKPRKDNYQEQRQRKREYE